MRADFSESSMFIITNQRRELKIIWCPFKDIKNIEDKGGYWEKSGYLGIVILKIIDFFCPYFFSKWIKINNRPSKVWCSKTPAGIFDFRWDPHLYVYLFSNFPNVMNKTWLGVIKNGPIRTSGTFSKQVGNYQHSFGWHCYALLWMTSRLFVCNKGDT